MTLAVKPDRTATEDTNGRSVAPRVLLVLPQVILAGGVALMLVVHPNAVRSGVVSTRAVLVNTALLGGWLLLSFVVLPRVVRNCVARGTILTVLALAALAVLVVPTLRDTVVVERFPQVAASPTSPAPTDGSSPGVPVAAGQPIRVSTGRLTGIDHDASGTASLYRQPDGSLVVGLEAIDIEPGPDYHVFVVPGRDRRSPGDGIELAKLKGNQGTQFYDVPGNRDVGDGWTVLIWCRAFGVPVAGATQST